MTQPLHHQLLSRANKLKKSGAASSIEHGLSLARTELEDERKRELQDAHCRALDEWARARSRESIADGRDVLRRVGKALQV